jgi:hypothetical protein
MISRRQASRKELVGGFCSSSTEAALQTLSYQHTGKAIFHFWKAEPASAAATAALADTNLLIYHKRILHIAKVWGFFRIFAADFKLK